MNVRELAENKDYMYGKLAPLRNVYSAPLDRYEDHRYGYGNPFGGRAPAGGDYSGFMRDPHGPRGPRGPRRPFDDYVPMSPMPFSRTFNTGAGRNGGGPIVFPTNAPRNPNPVVAAAAAAFANADAQNGGRPVGAGNRENGGNRTAGIFQRARGMIMRSGRAI